MAERLRVGNAEIAVASDADFRFAPSVFLPDVPREVWAPYLGDKEWDQVQESRVLTFVIRSRGKTILVDTGVGEWGLWRFGDGHLLDSLAALDVTPESVDIVLPTHLHADHVGWNMRPTAAGPVPTFPNARYLFQQADWDYVTSDAYLARTDTNTAPAMMRAAVIPMKDSGLIDFIGPEKVVTDEVTLVHTPGHTPGSVTVVVQSGGEAALLIGDVAHHPAQLTETDWSPRADLDPVLSAQSRRAMVDKAYKMNALIGSAHSPEPGPAFGRIILTEGRMYWRGVPPG
jgi:glyoxylase-like metal-dependent hydrolase (beta-lactamase superfamily II)